MKGHYTVCAAFVKNRVNELNKIGVDEATIYKVLKLTPASLIHPEKRIPIEQLVSLENSAPILTDCPQIAFKISKECKDRGDSKTGIVGQIAASAKTVGDGFHLAVRYSQLMSDAVYMDIHEHSKVAEFICTRKSPDIYTLFEAETAMIDSYNILCQFGCIYEIHFWHAQPAYFKRYDKVFNCKLKFNSKISKIVFDRAILEKENSFAQPYLNYIARDYADRLMDGLVSINSFSHQVYNIVIENISSGLVGVDFVADKLNMGRQSIYRKLKKEKMTFSGLLDNVRKELANKYIHVQKYSMIEIAFLLGFSDASSFNRAYRRWFKRNPSMKN